MIIKPAGLGLIFVLASASLATAQVAPPDPAALDEAVQSLPRASAVYVTGRSIAQPLSAASGEARPGVAMSVDMPLRIASNTKTFTAATVLRLWEQGRIDLDAPIGPLLTPALDALMRADGYDTRSITVRRLLSHSGGLYDHGSDPRFVQAITTDPGHEYSREELVRMSMDWADPQSAPGTAFRYSDTGYILLGDIVERITGQSLGVAVRDQLRLDRLDLPNTWWEIMEPAPAGAHPRAVQGLGAFDAGAVHASMDLYGGGGLLMSARDLATFFAALWEGRVFDRPETLREMLWQGPHQGGDHYRLGVFVTRTPDGRDIYWHSGFWGTLVAYDPESGVAVAGVTVNPDGFGRMKAQVEAVLGAPPLNP